MAPFESLPPVSAAAPRLRARPEASRAAMLAATPLGLYRYPPLLVRPSRLDRARRALARARAAAAPALSHLFPLGRRVLAAAWRELRLQPGRTARGLAAYVACVTLALLLANAALSFVAAAAGVSAHPSTTAEVADALRHASVLRIAVLVGLVAPCLEEAVFRWLPATLLTLVGASRRWAWPVGLASSASFALAHMPGAAGGLPLGQFVGGLSLWSAQRRYGLVGSIALHGAFNLTTVALARALG